MEKGKGRDGPLIHMRSKYVEDGLEIRIRSDWDKVSL